MAAPDDGQETETGRQGDVPDPYGDEREDAPITEADRLRDARQGQRREPRCSDCGGYGRGAHACDCGVPLGGWDE